MYRLFELFLNKMKAGFRRIARATKNEVDVDDLHNDAWLLAQDIGQRRGKEIDFSDLLDQELVMKAVNVQNVRRGDWKMRKSVRIDQEPENESTPSWCDRLPASASSDPFIALLLRESEIDIDAILGDSYSQAAAYVMVFTHFKNNRQAICTYLVISNQTLARRIICSANTFKVQPSLFDYIERIDKSFMPPRGKPCVPKADDPRETRQRSLHFLDSVSAI